MSAVTSPGTSPDISPGTSLTTPSRIRMPRIAGAAVERARLRVVPRRRVAAPRLPFIVLVSAILLGGLVGLLCFNTQMQQASFTATSLSRQADVLSARQQQLERTVQQLQSPQSIGAWAQHHRMVIPATHGTLKLTGSAGAPTFIGPLPEPADRSNTPRLRPLPRKKPTF